MLKPTGSHHWLLEMHLVTYIYMHATYTWNRIDMAVTSVLRVKVGPWGGTGGSPWDEGGGEGYTGIRSIKIASTWCIEGFLVEYDHNGRPVQGALHGQKQHGRGQTLDFPGEFLTHVSGYHDSFVRSLSFRTNRDRTFGTSGNEIGTPFSCSVDRAGAIVGFSGRSGSFLDAISLYIAVWNPDRFYHAMRQQRVLAIRTAPLSLQRGVHDGDERPQEADPTENVSKPHRRWQGRRERERERVNIGRGRAQ